MSDFKPGVFKCSCCGHYIFAFEEFVAPRGAAYKALSLTDGGDELFEPGKLCDILARNYSPVPDVRVAFKLETLPVPAHVLAEWVVQ